MGDFKGVDPLLDQDILDIQIAETLGVSALDVHKLPMHWVKAAIVFNEAKALLHKKEE